jgi:hypothetical protein
LEMNRNQAGLEQSTHSLVELRCSCVSHFRRQI